MTGSEMAGGTYVDELGCFVLSMSYDWNAHHGSLSLPGLSTTDMTGCIRLFRRLDPEVEVIAVYSVGGDFVAYLRATDNYWRALDAQATMWDEVEIA